MAQTLLTPHRASGLLFLPLELQKDVIEKLEVSSLLNIRLISRHFKSIISHPTHSTLLSAEKTKWAETRKGGLYACMGCRRLRPSKYFADAMRKGPKGRNGKEPHKRFCVECGIRWGGRGGKGYSPGAEIEVGGVRSVVCKKCGKWTEGGGEKLVGCKGSGLCGACHGGKEGCERAMRCVRGFVATSRKRGGGWRGSGREDDYELPDEYDEAFWECYDPAD